MLIHCDMILLRFHVYVGDLDALDDDMLCLALFLLLIFNAHMFLPWFNYMCCYLVLLLPSLICFDALIR